jgi:hypothetical protein
MKIKNWRLNIFDIIIIVAAIVAAVFLVRAADSGVSGIIAPGKSVTVRYTIELINMVEPSADLIKPGDKLLDKIEKYPLGTVISAQSAPYLASSKNSLTGAYILTIEPERQSATIVMEASATETDSAISVGGFEIRTGGAVNITGPGYGGLGYITAVERG